MAGRSRRWGAAAVSAPYSRSTISASTRFTSDVPATVSLPALWCIVHQPHIGVC
jgi:hypothetical protein